MTLPLWQIDAFADAPFRGNPAAVCLLPAGSPDAGWPGAAWLQAVAGEMNLSETAFLRPEGPGYRLRWLTPAVEVDLCGHATLASAHFLWESGRLDPGAPAHFLSRSGPLVAHREGEAIRLDFPARPAAPAEAPPGLLAALGVTALFVGRSADDYVVEVDSEERVRGLRPDFARLATGGARGVIVTARASTPGLDFVSRFFAPAAGVDEDPVTGSAHCCLAPLWAARLGKGELQARQLSARGGALTVRVVGDRVHLLGRAVTVLRGELVV